MLKQVTTEEKTKTCSCSDGLDVKDDVNVNSKASFKRFIRYCMT